MQSHIPNSPKMSFGKSLTFRTMDNRDNRSNGSSKSPSRKIEQGNIALSTVGRQGFFSPNLSHMVFHRVGNIKTPGVGDYNIGDKTIKNRQKSPNATIGNTIRF